MHFNLIYPFHCNHSNLVSKADHVLDQILLCIFNN